MAASSRTGRGVAMSWTYVLRAMRPAQRVVLVMETGWPVSVANATAGFCLAAVGFGSATGGWTQPAVQFMLAGACMLVASGLRVNVSSNMDRSGRVLLLLEGMVGVACLGAAVAVYFLEGDRHGTKRALVAEFGVGSQLELLERVLYNAGLTGVMARTATCGCLATLNLHDVLCRPKTSSISSRCATVLAAVGLLVVYLYAALLGGGSFGWTLSALLASPGELPNLLADIATWGAQAGQTPPHWEPSTRTYPVWKAVFVPQQVAKMPVSVDTVGWHAQTLESSRRETDEHRWRNASAAVHAQNDGVPTPTIASSICSFLRADDATCPKYRSVPSTRAAGQPGDWLLPGRGIYPVELSACYVQPQPTGVLAGASAFGGWRYPDRLGASLLCVSTPYDQWYATVMQRFLVLRVAESAAPQQACHSSISVSRCSSTSRCRQSSVVPTLTFSAVHRTFARLLRQQALMLEQI